MSEMLNKRKLSAKDLRVAYGGGKKADFSIVGTRGNNGSGNGNGNGN